MFYAPIRHTPLKTVSDVLNFSCRTGYTTQESKTFYQNYSNIFICDENGEVLVTPFREEIPIILEEYGFKRESCKNSLSAIPGTIKQKYLILEEIAKREKQLKIYEDNFKKAPKCDFKYIIPENLSFSKYELTHPIDGAGYNGNYIISPMFNGNDEDHNLSTFIIFHDDMRLLLCDEYGRTFHIVFESTEDLHIFVNFLLDCKFSYTKHPEKYISKKIL